MITENLKDVEARVCAACERSGRKREDVTLIAVSKTKPVEMLEEAYAYDCRYFGENKVQELDEKYDIMPKDIHWQMIGHLQRNKVKYIIDKAELIHSVDSIRLAETIDKEAAKKGIVVNVLLEVNMANVNMSILSMGMTNDFEVAIEEGATMVRIGTAIFGERNYAHQI